MELVATVNGFITHMVYTMLSDSDQWYADMHDGLER